MCCHCKYVSVKFQENWLDRIDYNILPRQTDRYFYQFNQFK